MFQTIMASRLYKQLTYTAITRHRAGSHNSPNKIEIAAPTHSGGFYLERRAADGTMRDAKQALPWEPPSAYLEGDVNAISVPLEKVTEFRTRYNQVKDLLFNFSNDMPNIKLIWLRANLMNLGQLDLTNCEQLEVLDISDNYVDSLLLPATSNLNFIYVGGLQMNDYPHKQNVIERLMDHILSNGINGGQMLSDPCIVRSTSDNVNTHHAIVNTLGWEVGHLTTGVGNYGRPNTAGTHNFDVMSSKYNWKYTTNDNWITINDPATINKSNEIVTKSFSVSANTTGLERNGIIYLEKFKDDGNGYKGITEISIRQDA